MVPDEDETIACRCEEVSVGEIRRAARLGATGPNQLKAFTRCGMGPCQGRTCGPVVAAILADVHGKPIAEIGRVCKESGVLFHTDATQAVGKLPFDVNALNVDLVSMSAHKMYGPKGVGALYVRRRNPRVLLAEQISGGGHERGMRSGTLNVPGIVGIGKAAALAKAEMSVESERLRTLRERLNEGLHRNLDEIYINGSTEHRLPHNLNISFAYVEGESLLMGINDVAVSSGSACTSASLEPSYVLKALGAGDDLAHSSIRFGLGRWTTEEEVDYVAAKLIAVVTRLREMSPLYELAKEGVDLSTMQWEVH